MRTLWQGFWQTLIGQRRVEAQVAQHSGPARPPQAVRPAVEIAPDDPLTAYFQTTPGAVEISKLDLDSPALRALREVGVQVVVPLVSQGELIGLLNLGSRLSEQDYSSDDYRLLDNLASQVAPAVRVAQLVRRQQAETLARERIEQELRVARLIQQTLLPKELPRLPGWQVAAYYQPAREVGGDFYDFLYFPDGRLGLMIADVTDKGVPAALVMATTRTLLRAVAQRLIAPGEVLERVNDLLCPDIPPKMFITCFYALLDPANGRLRYANAGHNLPYRGRSDGAGDDAAELRATGMPLGLLPGMRYEEKEAVLATGEILLFYSDGLVEAHNPDREMFGFPRLRQLMAGSLQSNGSTLIDFLLARLAEFTGQGWEQEDDVTLVTLERTIVPSPPVSPPLQERGTEGQGGWQTLAEFTFPSEPGNEHPAAKQAIAVLASLPRSVSPRRLEQLETAIDEAAGNAIEHGNRYRPEMPVSIEVLASATALAVRITDYGGDQPIPEPEIPNIEAKLAGLQKTRGWGLFLIKNMVDDVYISGDQGRHTIELILYLKGDEDAD